MSKGQDMERLAWFKFYSTDYQSDKGLRLCSLAARALWVEMLCIMHEADERGYLVIAGQPVSDRELAIIAGCGESEANLLRKELESREIFSRNKAGIIYSRRMVRDEKKATIARVNGANNDPTSTGKKRRNSASVTNKPTKAPTDHPTKDATKAPTEDATNHPTEDATNHPTASRARVPESRVQSPEYTLFAIAHNAADGGDGGVISDHIWKNGLPLLVRRGMAEKQARAMIGRWLKDVGPEKLDRAFVALEGSASQDPVAFVNGALQTRSDAMAAAFARFWAVYPGGPNKTDRPMAERVFAAIVRGAMTTIPQTDPEVIIAGARAYARTMPDPKFIPAPDRWLRGARWKPEAQDQDPAAHPFAGHPKLSKLNPNSPTFWDAVNTYWSCNPDEERAWNAEHGAARRAAQ